MTTEDQPRELMGRNTVITTTPERVNVEPCRG
jgi:hypothetical protein